MGSKWCMRDPLLRIGQQAVAIRLRFAAENEKLVTGNTRYRVTVPKETDVVTIRTTSGFFGFGEDIEVAHKGKATTLEAYLPASADFDIQMEINANGEGPLEDADLVGRSNQWFGV